MGYRHKKKRINIKFEEPHEFAGLEATLRSLDLGGFLAIRGIGEVDESAIEDQLRRFGEALISWNLEDEDTGQPVPPTAEAMFKQDKELMLALASEWMDSMAGVAAPLERPSTGGEPSPVESIPMEPLSESLAS